MASFRRGETVAGRFVLEGRLAAGGMGEVWIAEMKLPRGIARRVAIKRLHPHLAEDAESVAMFLDEVRLSAALAHPGLVSTLDAIESDGDLLIVMEYVPGWDLGAVLARAREARRAVPIDVAVSVGRGLCETLDYVHEARDPHGERLGIVHRDVTPSNVLIAEDGTVRLLDFGIAKARARTARTATRSLKGKLGYMAPEQAAGGAVDARTDLYGVGLVLFELLTGRKAIEGDGEYELLGRARTPVHVAPRSLRADVPPALDALVVALLEVDPGARPASARNALDALGAVEVGPDAGARATAAFVRDVVGSAARPFDSGRTKLEDALAVVAGLERFREARTAPAIRDVAAADGPTKADGLAAEVRAERASVASGAPRTRGLGIAAAVAVVALGAGLGWWTLGAGRAAPAGEPGPVVTAPAFARVTSDPPGAAIAVDGRATLDTTPAVIELAPGAHELALSLPGHDRAIVPALARAGATSRVTATLRLTPGRLSVTTTPAGARARLGDRDLGTTPLVAPDLPRAAAVLTLELDGHVREERPVDLATTVEQTVDVALRPEIAYGTLDVSSTPWARVSIDGRVVAESTPALDLRVPEGEHVVVLDNPRTGRSARRTVRIERGRRASLVVTLPAP